MSVLRTLLLVSCALLLAACQPSSDPTATPIAVTKAPVPKLPQLKLSQTLCADKGWAAVGALYGWKHKASGLSYSLGGLPVDTCLVGGGRKLSVAITEVTPEQFDARVLAKRTSLGLPRTIVGADSSAAWAGYGIALVDGKFVSYEAGGAGVFEVVKGLTQAVTLLPEAAKSVAVAGAGECSVIAPPAREFLGGKVIVQRGSRSSSDALRCAWASAKTGAVTLEMRTEFDAAGGVRDDSGDAEEVDLGEMATFDAGDRTLRVAVSAQQRVTIAATSGKRPVADYIAFYEKVKDLR